MRRHLIWGCQMGSSHGSDGRRERFASPKRWTHRDFHSVGAPGWDPYEPGAGRLGLNKVTFLSQVLRLTKDSQSARQSAVACASCCARPPLLRVSGLRWLRVEDHMMRHMCMYMWTRSTTALAVALALHGGDGSGAAVHTPHIDSKHA